MFSRKKPETLASPTYSVAEELNDNGFPASPKKLISLSREDKLQEVRLWDLCILFLEGRQWLSFDRRLRQYVVDRRATDDDKQATINLILNIFRNVVSRLQISYPSTVVLPASPSPDDIVKAQSSESALRYFWAQADLKAVIADVVEYSATTGTSAIHTYYDEDEEKLVSEAIQSYDLFFEKGVISIDESSWVALRTIHNRADLIEAYPKLETEILQASGMARPDDQGDGEPPPNRVEVYEFYYRDGRHAIVIDDIYLYEGERQTKTFPVQVVHYTRIPRRIWGLGLIEPLIDLQWLYNRTRSQITNNVELMANPKWLIPKTAGVAAHQLTNKAGEKVYYNAAGGKPSMVAGEPLPNYVLEHAMRLQVEMSDVSGAHSVSLGKRSVGVSSGRAMEVLTERDTSQLQLTQTRIEQAVRNTAKCALELMKAFYTEERMTRMMDEYGKVVFRALSSESIVDDPEIFIEAGSMFRAESQDRDLKVMQLVELGMLPPEEGMKELSFRTGNSFISHKISAISHARETLYGWLANPQLEIEIFMNDDLEAFEQVFGDYMREPAYYELPVEQQEYLRDVLAEIITAGMPPEALQAALQNQQVSPRPQGGAGGSLRLAASNPNASMQQQVQGSVAASDMENRIGGAERRLGGADTMKSGQFGGIG